MRIVMEIELAGIALQINAPRIEKFRPLLNEYAGEPENILPVQVELSEQDIKAQIDRSRMAYERKAEKRNVSELEHEFTALFRKTLNVLIEQKVIYLHGSLLAVNGKGYLFMAPSGTGKSTHARLWKERYGDLVTVINDDKPLIKAESDGSIRAYGSPWKGKHRIGCNSAVSLKAIVRLRRGSDNRISALNKDDALKMLYMHTLHFEEASKMKTMLEVIGAIIENVSFYDLECNTEIEAAEVAYEELVNSQG